MPKYSQIKPTITTILSNAVIAVLQAGKVSLITFQNMMKNYYTKTQVDQLISNIQAGGLPWQEKELADQSLPANQATPYTHNLHNDNFRYDFLEWNNAKQKYLKSNYPPIEVDRTDDTVTLMSSESIDRFKLVFIG